ncbi:MAG TPA: zinc ribbon domain-containing protein [Terriglobales bacterium]|nr:zinc ribbon domain-containing protein [Terriglobales bacterium]
MTCPRCGLALPAIARFCARCGFSLPPGAAAVASADMAPVWLLALLWVGSAGLLLVAALYGTLATGLVQPGQIDPSVDPAQVRPTAAVVAACAASLCAAHAVAAIGLMGRRVWARTFATLVCVVWALTCVGLPLGLLGINALWRPRRGARGVGTAEAIR